VSASIRRTVSSSDEDAGMICSSPPGEHPPVVVGVHLLQQDANGCQRRRKLHPCQAAPVFGPSRGDGHQRQELLVVLGGSLDVGSDVDELFEQVAATLRLTSPHLPTRRSVIRRLPNVTAGFLA
jgi:hypothetical protein